MDARTRFGTKIVGALPVVAAFLKKLGVAEIVDEVVPWEGEVPLGTLTEIMMCNRLLNPVALFRIGDWAEQAGVTTYYGVSKEELNDDRLGRALERLTRYQQAIQARLVARAIRGFRLEVRQIHYDISNVELYGAYTRQLSEAGGAASEAGQTDEAGNSSNGLGPSPAYGRTKSGRKNVKQILFGINVTRDGAVPISHMALDGNAAEAKTHIENLKRLQEILPGSKLVYSADSKLDTVENLLAIAVGKGLFLCAGVFTPELKKQYRKLARQQKLKEVDYCPKSKAHLPPEDRPKYKVAEVPAHLQGNVDGRNVRVNYRLVYVWSEAKAVEEAKTRKRHLQKIQDEFETVERNLNKYKLTTDEAVVRRLEIAKGKYAEGEVFDYKVTKQRGKLQLSWSINQATLRARKEVEGVYVLKASLPKSKYATVDLLREYKEQIHVERRIGDIKGPLAVAPMFLEKPERMAGLLCILVWSLMVLALMERSVRRSLKGKPMYGLYPENRPSAAPTGKSILTCFSTLCIVIIKESGNIVQRLAELSDVQRALVHHLGIPPNDLAAFKRKCCSGAT
jgi:transposase